MRVKKPFEEDLVDFFIKRHSFAVAADAVEKFSAIWYLL